MRALTRLGGLVLGVGLAGRLCRVVGDEGAAGDPPAARPRRPEPASRRPLSRRPAAATPPPSPPNRRAASSCARRRASGRSGSRPGSTSRATTRCSSPRRAPRCRSSTRRRRQPRVGPGRPAERAGRGLPGAEALHGRDEPVGGQAGEPRPAARQHDHRVREGRRRRADVRLRLRRGPAGHQGAGPAGRRRPPALHLRGAAEGDSASARMFGGYRSDKDIQTDDIKELAKNLGDFMIKTKGP